MNRISFFLWVLLTGAVGCFTPKKASMIHTPLPDLQGHRGSRGLMPENTIPAMLKAIDLGVTTLEMDVVISRDKQVVVSHDPYFNENITTTPAGGNLTKEEAQLLLLYQMDYDRIRRYDVGLKLHPGFPQQQKLAVSKPLLGLLIDSCEAYAAKKGKQIGYNIEIKSQSGFDNQRHPAPPEFSELLVGVLRKKGILERTTIQSFDVRPLQYLHAAHPEIRLSYLVEAAGTLDDQLQLLGFTPAIFSPLFTQVTPELVKAAHAKGMKVIPWTVNSVQEMKLLLEKGVDGLISDYPDLFAQLGK
jgi:glycerophosphoryl diester phosphodiesterase